MAVTADASPGRSVGPRSRLGDAAATRARLLAEAVALLRRHGPAKLTVTDIARRCGMSHANVCRFFPNKTAIYAALAADCFAALETALTQIAEGEGDAVARLEAFVLTMLRLKRQKIAADRQLFAAYLLAAGECPEIVAGHVARLRALLRRIVADGVAQQAFRVEDVDATVAAIEWATWRFRHPRLILEHCEEPLEQQAQQVLRLLIAGLRNAETAGSGPDRGIRLTT